MTFTCDSRTLLRGWSLLAANLLMCAAVGAWQATPAPQAPPTPTPTPATKAAPTLTAISPAARADATQNSVSGITLTGSGFSADGLTLVFTPPVISAPTLQVTNATTLTATFVIHSTASGAVQVQVKTADGISQKFPWDTGTVDNICIEALQTGGCAVRWELNVTGVTNSSSQTSNTTTPNILTTLDLRRQVGKTKKGEGGTRFVMHGIFEGGYTQVPTATKLKPATSSSSTPGTTSSAQASCASTTGSSTIPASCMAIAPQQAFIAEAGGTLGATFAQNAQSGFFAELGLHFRGSVQDLIQSNQVITSGGLSYVDLSSLNSKNVVGLYEAAARFRLSAKGHNKLAPNGKTSQNVSNLLLIEAGYQYNSGMQGLSGNPMANTRQRFVGRFYLYPPELPGGTHTKAVVGLEYSGGINGGPKVIQIFWGTNLNPSKLASPVPTNQ